MSFQYQSKIFLTNKINNIIATKGTNWLALAQISHKIRATGPMDLATHLLGMISKNQHNPLVSAEYEQMSSYLIERPLQEQKEILNTFKPEDNAASIEEVMIKILQNDVQEEFSIKDLKQEYRKKLSGYTPG